MSRKKVNFSEIQATEAHYRELNDPYFKGNPYIECLPDDFTEDDIFKMFLYIPQCNEKMRQGSLMQRYKYIENLKLFRIPMKEHLFLAMEINSMITYGYLFHKPVIKDEVIITSRTESIPPELYDSERGASSLMILGTSGVGKTTAISTLLNHYPDLIGHSSYQGKPLVKYQIPYLKVDCPANATIGGFYDTIIAAFDSKIKTSRYFNDYVTKNYTLETRREIIVGLVREYSLGLLVIDETQNLLDGKKNGQELTNVFTELTNTLQIPIIFIGTPRAQNLFGKNMRSSRRLATDGIFIWDRYKKDSQEWKTLIKNLWPIQYTKTITPLDDKLESTLYELSQGIIALTITLYANVQRHVMLDEANPEEKITPEIILEAAKSRCPHLLEITSAISEQNFQKLQMLEDIIFDWNYLQQIDIKKISNQTIIENIEKEKTQKELDRQEQISDIFTSIKVSGLFENLNDSLIMEVIKKDITENNSLDPGELKKRIMSDLLESFSIPEKSEDNSTLEILENARSENSNYDFLESLDLIAQDSEVFCD